MAESSRSFDNVTRQIAREEILNNQRRESFKSYIKLRIELRFFPQFFGKALPQSLYPRAAPAC